MVGILIKKLMTHSWRFPDSKFVSLCSLFLLGIGLVSGCSGLGGEPAIIETLAPPIATEEAQAPAPVATEEAFALEATEEPSVIGRVTGHLINGTAGGQIPSSLPVTLSSITDSLDLQTVQTFQTTTDADGSFIFDGVEIAANRLYIAASTYRERNFGSESAVGDPLAGTLDLPITIYELTEDRAVLSIAETSLQIHSVGDNLDILESVRMRNESDRVFSSSTAAGTGRFATVAVNLPVGAVITGFDNQERYVPLPEQFAIIDTLPVLPGEDHTLRMSYLLAYNGGAIIEYQVAYAYEGQLRLLVDSDALTLNSDQVQYTGTETIDQTTYQVYEGDLTLVAGDVVRFEISGIPDLGTSADQSVVTSNNLLPIFAGIALILLVLVSALFLLQSRGRVIPVNTDQVINGLVKQIAELDSQHEQGQINHDLYQRRRSALKARLAQLMDN